MSKKPSQYLGDQLRPFIAPFRFNGSGDFHLKSHKTNEKGGLDKDKAEKILEANRKRLSDFQEKLYAQNRWSVLLIFQGMDAAGKDSAIKAVFAGVNPQGCEVHSFKQPSANELEHDFLWRHAVALPQRGHIGIFNRSHYEECLVPRVHREVLAKERIPPQLVTKNIWRERFEDISAFERYLSRNGTVILMVRPGGDRLGDRQHARNAELAVSANRQGFVRGVQAGARGSGERREGACSEEGGEIARRVAKGG